MVQPKTVTPMADTASLLWRTQKCYTNPVVQLADCAQATEPNSLRYEQLYDGWSKRDGRIEK